MEPEAKRQKIDITGRRMMKSYKRYDKPPYSYVGMTALILRAAPRHRLSLAGILNTLPEMFPFFNGEYQGWKDSVRHNLSNNDCFYKVPELVNNVKRIKKCNWAVDLEKLPMDAMVRQDCRKTKEYYAPTLTDHFNLPPIHLVLQGTILTITMSKLANPPPEHFIEQQPFRAPERQRVPRRPRPFNIDSLLDTSRSSSSPYKPAYIRHIQFPKTMFDDQTPEKALENLRQLCGSNPSDQKPSTDTSFETSPSTTLCDVTNTHNSPQSKIPQSCQLKKEYSEITEEPALARRFAAPLIKPSRSYSFSDQQSESCDSLSTPTTPRSWSFLEPKSETDSFLTSQASPSQSNSFTEPVTPTRSPFSIISTPVPPHQQATRIASTPLSYQSCCFGILNTPRQPASASPFSSSSNTRSPIFNPTDLSLTSPSSTVSTSLQGSSALQLDLSASSGCRTPVFSPFHSIMPYHIHKPTEFKEAGSLTPDHFVERSFFF